MSILLTQNITDAIFSIQIISYKCSREVSSVAKFEVVWPVWSFVMEITMCSCKIGKELGGVFKYEHSTKLSILTLPTFLPGL